MKKFTIALFAIAGIISLLSLSSCKKVWDYVKQHPDGAADNCKVDKVAFRWYNEDAEHLIHDTAKVQYNSYGDPVTVKYSSGGLTVAVYQNSGFKYDNQHRLIAYLENAVTEMEYGDYWHKYTYVNSTTIVDTVFVYASGNFFSDDRPTYDPCCAPQIRIQKYTLDSYGRIIKWVDHYNSVFTYAYDGNGNLVKPGVTYTNKTNIKQTHKVWMFITQDFSVNAPVGQATEYNSNKLPVKAKDIDFFAVGALGAESMGDRQVRITYLCK